MEHGKEVRDVNIIATAQQQEAVVNDLICFVHRVALNKNATPAEIAALPEVAKVLCAVMPGTD